MREHYWRFGLTTLAATSWALAACLGLGLSQGAPAAAANEPPPIPNQEEPEPLTRGPVHEAFAEPVNLETAAGVLALQEPPAPINEVAPDQRPEGSYTWVPGYWAWDGERASYIWVSGCWRQFPPGRTWAPGYWARRTGGWEWIPGFWTHVRTESVEYLPAPPAPIEIEAVSVAPTRDSIWVPDCYYWTHGRYIRRPGYWLVAQPGWVWVPSHYICTPRGYVFVRGHWDYPLEHRGVLFAPVCFPRPVYLRPGYRYSASIVINLGAVRLSLFTYPRYSHYYFGDYYDDVYLRMGIYPTCAPRRVITCYDPIYVHERWSHHRYEPRWEEYERRRYDERRSNHALRPPRSYGEMETRLAQTSEPQQQRSVRLAQPLTVAAAEPASSVKFTRINEETRQQITRQSREQLRPSIPRSTDATGTKNRSDRGDGSSPGQDNWNRGGGQGGERGNGRQQALDQEPTAGPGRSGQAPAAPSQRGGTAPDAGTKTKYAPLKSLGPVHAPEPEIARPEPQPQRQPQPQRSDDRDDDRQDHPRGERSSGERGSSGAPVFRERLANPPALYSERTSSERGAVGLPAVIERQTPPINRGGGPAPAASSEPRTAPLQQAPRQAQPGSAVETATPRPAPAVRPRSEGNPFMPADQGLPPEVLGLTSQDRPIGVVGPRTRGGSSTEATTGRSQERMTSHGSSSAQPSRDSAARASDSSASDGRGRGKDKRE